MPCRGPEPWELIESELLRMKEDSIIGYIVKSAEHFNVGISVDDLFHMTKETLISFYMDLTRNHEHRKFLVEVNGRFKLPQLQSKTIIKVMDATPHHKEAVRILCVIAENYSKDEPAVSGRVGDKNTSTALMNWYQNHQEYDKERKAHLKREALRKLEPALKNLSHAEREALGLD
jgi:hypothetical protein